jgi:hypothetical protein
LVEDPARRRRDLVPPERLPPATEAEITSRFRREGKLWPGGNWRPQRPPPEPGGPLSSDDVPQGRPRSSRSTRPWFLHAFRGSYFGPRCHGSRLEIIIPHKTSGWPELETKLLACLRSQSGG